MGHRASTGEVCGGQVGLLQQIGFDDKFDATAAQTRRKAPERIAIFFAIYALSSPLLGSTKGFYWLTLVLSAELWLWISTSPRFIAKTPVTARIQRLMASLLSSGGYVIMGCLFWFSREPMSELLAVAVLSGIMIYVVRACYRTPIHMLVGFGPPAVVLTLLPLSYAYDTIRFVALESAFLLLVGFSVVSGVSAYRAHVGLAAAARKLTERSEAADAANQAKSDFLANMSHEIRTPLNGVLGMAQAMAMDDLPPAQRERLTLIRQSGEALLALLNDLLDLSKIEAGKIELEDAVIDVGEMARSAQTAFTTLLAAKDLYLVVEVAPEANGRWRGDATRVRQILYNLVSNAVKFTAQGSVQVFIDHDGAQLIMEVSDTGPGIPEDRLESLFDKFVQADASTTRRFGGTGLGLAICRELADLMGGSITVNSVVGQGSTFRVRLPLERVEGPAVAEDCVRAAAMPAAGLSILAAEDNSLNRLVLKTLLGQVGVDPYLVENGAEALAAWENGDWDVILMDVQMPVMDGPNAARCIRAREQETGRARTPIIALTANTMAHHAAEYAACGMDALVSKPLEFARLLEAIDSVLDAAAQTLAARIKAVS